MDKEIHVSITTGTVFKVLLVLAGAWLLFYLYDLILAVLTAIVIASGIEPLVASLQKRRIPRIIAVISIYACFLGIFAILFYFFLPSLLSDAVTFISRLPTYLEAFTRIGAFDEFAAALGLPETPAMTAETLLAPLRAIVTSVSAGAFTAASSLVGGVLSLAIVIVFSFYLTLAETGVDDFLRVIVPMRHQEYALGLWKRAQHKIGLWMQGQLLLALFMGVFVFLGLFVLGVPNALLLGVIAAVFELVPVFGPILAAIPAVAIAFIDGGVSLGVLAIALYVILQQFENHLLYPAVVTWVVGVPPLLVVLALVIGVNVAGFWGILLSVPVAATVQEFVKDVQNSRKMREKSA